MSTTEYRALLADALGLMKALHESAQPDETHEYCIIPGAAFYAFVDGHAQLLRRANELRSLG